MRSQAAVLGIKVFSTKRRFENDLALPDRKIILRIGKKHLPN